MSKRRKRKYKKKKKNALDYVRLPKAPSINIDPDTKKSIIIIIIMLLGIVSLLGLFDLAGTLGIYLTNGLALTFGWGKSIFPFILMGIAFIMYNEDKYIIKGASYLGLILFVISFQSILHFFVEHDLWEYAANEGYGGGHVGLFLVTVFTNLLGYWGGLVVLIGLLLVSLMLLLNKSLRSLIGSESVFARVLYPALRFLGQVFKRGERGEDYEDEEGFEDDEEEVETKDDIVELEEDINEEDFEKTEVSEVASSAPVAVNPKTKTVASHWVESKIKIDLPLNLLSSKIDKPTSGDIKNNAVIIQRTLENFNIAVNMGDVSVGPTVTQYTFKPAEGIKLSRITTLNNDLSLSLAAHPIRIEAPIPGKALVGIEVPNQTKAIVGLREILESREFKARKNNLTLALGKDVSGKSWSYDLSKMPHLLVAGATNSGKSVCLNSIIVSLLYQNNPDDLRFIMVDPKRVELPVYNGIPHLLTPVIIDVNKTINALKWCLNEMDRRFELLSQSGKRNIQAYNKVAEKGRKGMVKMPYIVFIIDELADLMVVAARDVETGIIRLAQMARAVGIHLILATQRPSVDVITGLIKANMPARVAFSVASGVDSKTILDSLGAEKLLGQGDMLFVTAELSKPKRIQGAYLSDLEIKKVVRYIKDNSGEFDYLEGVTDSQKVVGMGGIGIDDNGGRDEDDLLGEAKEIVINMNKASASLLQRRLSIGYARAARIIDMLEEIGVVGPANGAKAREILISKEQYEASINQGVSGVSLHSRDEAEEPDSYLDDQDHDVPPVLKDDSSEELENDDKEIEEFEKEIEDDDVEIIETKEEEVEIDEELEDKSIDDENKDENHEDSLDNKDIDNKQEERDNDTSFDKFFSR